MNQMDHPVDGRRVLFAEFTATEGNADSLAELVRGFAARVRAEPGNLVFAANRRADDPSRFFVYEEYADETAFAAHLASEHGAEFNRALAVLTGGVGSRLTELVSA